jgi:uncharacterized membrane protein HdeD (DUF308 family)
MVTSTTPHEPGTGLDILRRSRVWFLALGASQIVIGMIAVGSAVFATIVSMILFIDLLTGVLYAVVGFMFLGNPAEAAVTSTFLIALFLLVGGIFRMIASLLGTFQHRGWLFLSGAITLLMGMMIWRQWPLSGLWVIGLFIGIEMIFYGWSLVMLGVAAGQLADVPGRRV